MSPHDGTSIDIAILRVRNITIFRYTQRHTLGLGKAATRPLSAPKESESVGLLVTTSTEGGGKGEGAPGSAMISGIGKGNEPLLVSTLGLESDAVATSGVRTSSAMGIGAPVSSRGIWEASGSTTGKSADILDRSRTSVNYCINTS